MSACGGLGPPKREDPAAISARVQIPDLMTLPDRSRLTLSQLEVGLVQYLNNGKGTPTEQLKRLYSKWGVRPAPETQLILEADLDGNGTVEVLTTLNDASSALGSGTLSVIQREGDQYVIDRSAEIVIGAGLHAVADLDQDGTPEIIWSSTSAGANTPTTTLFLSTWKPGHLQTTPTGISSTYAKVEVAGSEILIHGGLKGGYGAGKVQRVRTDRYRLNQGKLQQVDARYAPSAFGYHLLQDGILAEQWSHTDEARRAYQKAMEPQRTVLFTEDTVPLEWEERLGYAVRTFARFRLGLLHVQAGQMEKAATISQEAAGPYAGLVQVLRGAAKPEDACQSAAAWATANPEFLQALNIPRGWANPQWKPDSLCGPLPIH